MKKMTAAAISAVIVISSSCQKDDTIMYGNTTMGNMTEEGLISDNGHLLRIVEQNCGGYTDSMKRVYTIGDVLRKTEGGQENEYDIRLNYIYEPLCKDILDSSETGDVEDLGDDPIKLESCWFSGGYINMIISIRYDGKSGKAHLINLVKEDERNGQNTIYLRLRHNAYGDTTEDNAGSITNDLVTFPFARLVPDTVSEIKVVVLWDWFDDNGNIKESSTSGVYRKGGFEQPSARLLRPNNPAILN